jgi:uncharacterized membrane protein
MIGETFLRRFRDEVELVEHVLADGARRLVPHWKHVHPPVRDVNREFQQSFTLLERLALMVTTRVGSPGFFLLIATWTVAWLFWNTLGPRHLRFDPAPAFVLWLFISNMIQIFLMPLIMVGQNLLSRHAELRAEADFEINQKAERERAFSAGRCAITGGLHRAHGRGGGPLPARRSRGFYRKSDRVPCSSSSCRLLRKSRMALPSEWPMSARRAGPKISRAIRRMTTSSPVPMLPSPIAHPSSLQTYRGSGPVPTSSGTPGHGEALVG